MKKPVVVVGSINQDLVASAEHMPRPGETVEGRGFAMHGGGKGANQAVAVARLGYPVHMIGNVGRDSFGAQLRASLVEAGVDCSAVAEAAGSSGVALIVVDDRGENSIVVVPGANAQVLSADLDRHIDLIRGAGIVLTQLEIPLRTVEHLAEMCEAARVPMMLDPAPAQALPHALLRRVTFLTPNETEAAVLCGRPGSLAQPAEQVRTLLQSGVRGVILKLSANGVLLATEGGPVAAVAAFKVDPTDTTAAGDCFNGAFAAALMQGRSALESARFAAAAAAISVTRKGAQPSMPSLAEVEHFLLHGTAPAAGAQG